MIYRRSLVLILVTLFLAGLQIRPNAGAAAKSHTKVAIVGEKQRIDDGRLVLGVPVAGELMGRKHYFTIAAVANQYIRLTIAPMDVNILLTIYGPDGVKIVESRRRYFGTTPVSLVTNQDGTHRVEIGLTVSPNTRVHYEIKLDQQRKPVAQDQSRITAEATVREAEIAKTRAEKLQKWGESLLLWRDLGEQHEKAYALARICEVHYYLDQHQQALQRGQEALTIWRSLNDLLGQAETLFLLGATKYDIGQIGPALNDYQEAMGLWTASNSIGGQAKGAVVLGVFYKRVGDYHSAITLGNQALDIFRQLQNKPGETSALNSLGSIYLKIGYYQNAADIAHQALALAEETGVQIQQKLAHGMLGEALLGQGDPNAALMEFNKELLLYEPDKDLRVKAYTLGRFGQAYDALGNRATALNYYQQALDLHRQVGNLQGEAETLNRMGWTMEQDGQRQPALDRYRQALPMSHDIADRAGEISVLRNLARVQRDLGHLEDASKNVQQAIDLIESTRLRTGGWQQRSSYLATMQETYGLRVDLLMRQREQQLLAGASEEAARLTLEALQASDRARARTLLESLAEARAEIRKTTQSNLLDREQDLQHRLNLKDEQRISLLNGPKDKPEADRRREADSLAVEQRALNDEYDQLQEQIRRAFPRYAELMKPPTLTGDQIKQLLDDQTVLLAYSLGDQRSYLWAVTRDSLKSYPLPPRREIEDKARNVHRWMTEEERLDGNNIERFARQAKLAKGKYWPEAAALSQMLLGPVAAQLGQTRLLIVGEGALQRLSFAALPEPQTRKQPDGGRGRKASRPVTKPSSPSAPLTPLIANHEIVYLPSISVLAAINKDIAARQPAPKTLALYADPIFSGNDVRLAANRTALSNPPVRPREKGSSALASEGLQEALLEMGHRGVEFGFPRLFGTKIEADYITSFVDPNSRLVAMNAEANVESIKAADLTQYRLIHFATHGLINNENPELSGLVLSLFDAQGQRQKGFLRMHEIYNLKLKADVVVLSACESGVGKQVGGEGLMALTRGFFYAGAPRVVASLWTADDRATPVLMREFYQQLIEKRATPAAALKAAQLAVRGRKQWQAPYYWAGFVLQGEYK